VIAEAALTDDLYHYTSSSVALDSVLPQMRLRLGLVEFVNDPYESRPRYPNLSIAKGVPELGPSHEETMRQADRLLRRAAKVACFTQDYELPESVLNPSALRGYAHPALWSHYGAEHSGVCLQFSRRALAERMRDQFRVGSLFEGAVQYQEDVQGLAQAVGLDVEQIHEFGLDVVVTSYVERYHRELFFLKHPDWATEAEYRWVFVNQEPLPVYLNIAGALTGLVLGDAFPEARLDAVYELANRFGLAIRRVHFLNRWLHVSPMAEPPIPSPSPHRRSGSFDSRLQQLTEAESDAEQASRLGEQITSPLVERLEALVATIATTSSALPEVDVAVYDSPTAVPSADRRRAPGVPTYAWSYQRGAMCVVENLPRYSVTFVASAAVQAAADERIKLHAAYEIERWRQDDPNERIELWRFAEEAVSDDATTIVQRLVGQMSERLAAALAEFDEMRASQEHDTA
jgi:Protein of unknown function (DUF2971)